jgi:predicted amidohydrolase YtcJ
VTIRRRDLLRLLAAAPLACRSAEPDDRDRPVHQDMAKKPGPNGQAELLVHGGAIWTMDPANPEVEAVAAAGGRVLAVGRLADLAALRGPGTVDIDLAGGLAVPGLTDAHAHLLGLGAELDQVDLRGARSIEEAVARVREQAPPTGWVIGRGWDQNLWPGAAMPTHAPLTAAFPDRPVWLRRVDGHAGWANAATLAAAGITRATANPQGGEILRDAAGEPTGVLVDNAMSLVPVPEPTDADLRRRILAAQDRVLACGLTGVHEMGVGPRADAILRQLAADKLLKLRMTGYADEDWFKQAHIDSDLHREPDPSVPYRLVGVKLYVDGALGSRGAALLAPYADRPDHSGILMHAPGELDALVLAAVRHGWQVAAHAIGDRGIRVLLDACAAARGAVPAADPRLRVEHAQIVDLADIPRFASLGAVASMQPTHATSDMAWAPARLGQDRLAGAYAWRRFLAAGVPLAFGSDFPVELPDVTHGLAAAVSRQDAAGQPPGGWLPDQRVSLDEAVAAFTRGAAFAARQTSWCGHLAPGMVADLTCFRADLRGLAPAALRAAAVRATIVGGAVAWQA